MWLPVKNLVPTAVLFGYVSPLKTYWYNESLLIIINDMCNSLGPDNFWRQNHKFVFKKVASKFVLSSKGS